MTATAVHVDETARIREEVGFFGPDGAQLYGCLHAPLRDPRAGVVLCCSIHAELQESYRLEVLVARTLARRGIAVQRFHYRGCGHSDGMPEALTFDAMRTDALAAAQQLAGRTGVARPAFMGSRLGGLIAASAGRTVGGAPLVLWAPTFAPERYFRDAVRARLIHQMRRGGESRRSTPVPPDPAVLDVFGYPVHRTLRESVAGRSLHDELGPRPGPVLLVQLGGNGTPDPAYAELTRQLEQQGVRAELEIVDEQPAWWFSGGIAAELARLGAGTADWLLARTAGGPS